IDLSISSLHALLQSSENSPFYLSINASPIQVTQKGFAERFISGFSSEHLSPNCISLEITETALMQNTDIVLENLKMIRDAGFNLAIDDFGTGYSSLSYLEKYPFTHLKIDKSFIDHIPGNNQKTHLLNAIMDISRAFKMKVIAEGIESQDQMQYLKGIGCHLGQGYYFGRPEPLEQFRTRLQETNEAVCMA
ncbi:MAG: EAL domain-containing protein, partial [Thiolinea sp.]